MFLSQKEFFGHSVPSFKFVCFDVFDHFFLFSAKVCLLRPIGLKECIVLTHTHTQKKTYQRINFNQTAFPCPFRVQTTQRGFWPAVAAGHIRTRLPSICLSLSLTGSSLSRPAPALWPFASAAATMRGTSCRATLRPTASLPASAKEHSSPSWPASLSC